MIINETILKLDNLKTLLIKTCQANVVFICI